MPEKQKTITFGQLREKLHRYGYTDHRVEGAGRDAISFDNDAVPGSRILLPVHQDDQIVDPYHLNHVWFILRSTGIVKECNPLLS